MWTFENLIYGIDAQVVEVTFYLNYSCIAKKLNDLTLNASKHYSYTIRRIIKARLNGLNM